ncbi:serine hydrolase domain-containing protein [Pseudobacter ginsenosidimutans]|uniref:CubicO group peptidase (Beta-lactamase class C family) n=1 Tax=Pseudobacter ginsenosidimutans TaxID=661488 RepID=A0A4Q7N3K5_9BACT|nr:serine hydrolase domain-containing protein [Pseudobacter ginsenosidimutans]QEC43890.1 beta-lactamase family protein [Pseudobacter ginsenosidimutans]RZS75318.1 CubicO group peptidase (beta-lactamase class C family) [Pseudobacter ginsenosidimutans]
MKTINTVAFLLILLASSCLVRGQARQTGIDTLVMKLGETFMNDQQAVGLSIGVYNNGEVSFYNFGTIEKGKAIQPTQNTVYEIGSVTKAFVSLILANAVIEKKVNLNDDIRKYLHGHYPNLEYAKKPITVEQLANTTSGLPNWLPATPKEITNAPADSSAFLRDRIYGSYTEKDFYTALRKVELDTIPGFKTRHSNAAAQLLTYILEKVYATSIDNLVKKYVLEPNKMDNTSFLASASNSKSLAMGYDGKGNKMPYFTTQYMKGVGGLNSTTADLMKFIKLQLDKKDDAISLTQKRSFDAGYYSIGLSWLKYKHDNGKHQVWTDGGTYGFVSYIVFYPEINSGVVLLSNIADDSTPGKLGNIAYQLFELMQRQ